MTSLEQHRFLTTHQVCAFLGESDDADGAAQSAEAAARATRRALRRQARSGLIAPVVPRRVGGIYGGATPNVWQLTAAGYAIVTRSQRRHRPSEPSTRFLDHTLAIGDAHLAVLGAASQLGGSAAVHVEAEAIRHFATPGGGLARLAPDLFVTVQGRDHEGPFEDAWFIEVDRGTESIPTLLRKCEQYEIYRRSGTELSHGDGAFPLVLWVMGGRRGPTRALELERQIARHDRLESNLFRFALPDTLGSVLTAGGAT